MQACSILVGVDQKYYDDWASTLLKSINFNCPDIKLRCHVVNPKNLKKLPFVEYTTEEISFDNEDSKISYLQAVRFLAVSKIPTTEFVLTIDADTICCKKFTKEEFINIFDKQNILVKDKKPNRLLCGFVSFNSDNLRYEYAELLNSKPVSQWLPGRDQKMLSKIKDRYNFVPVERKWMSIGKQKKRTPTSVFLTLKGEQKLTYKYLKHFDKFTNKF